MSIWQNIAKALSYPQSVLTGITGMAPGMLGDPRNSAGNSEVLKAALNFNQQVAPSQLMAINQPYAGGSVVDKVGGSIANVMYDPLTWSGGSGLGRKAVEALPAGIGQSRVAQELLKGAGTFGKIEDASKTARVGQLGRQAYQATLGAGEYGLGGILAGTGVLHAGEGIAAKYLPKVAMKLLEQNVNPVGAEAAVANATSDVPSVFELMAGNKPMGELMPAAKVPNVQVPVAPALPGAAEQAGLGLRSSGVNVMDPNNEINQLIAALHDPKQRIQLLQKLAGREPLVFPGG